MADSQQRKSRRFPQGLLIDTHRRATRCDCWILRFSMFVHTPSAGLVRVAVPLQRNLVVTSANAARVMAADCERRHVGPLLASLKRAASRRRFQDNQRIPVLATESAAERSGGAAHPSSVVSTIPDGRGIRDGRVLAARTRHVPHDSGSQSLTWHRTAHRLHWASGPFVHLCSNAASGLE